MGRTDLVVAIGANQQEVPHLGMRRQVFEQLKRRGVEPLQIVEEQGKRVLWAGEYPEEPAEHPLKPVLALLRWQLRNRRLRADDQRELGDQNHHELAIGAQRLEQRLPPVLYLLLASAEELAHQQLKGLRQGDVGDVTLGTDRICRRRTGRVAAPKPYEAR